MNEDDHRTARRTPRIGRRRSATKIVARNVNVFYGAKQALFDVDLDIPSASGDGASSARRAAASRPSCAASTA
jgi:shikimate kinase